MNKFRNHAAVAALATGLTVPAVNAAPFDIVVSFTGAVSTAQAAAFSAAEAYWESVITGYRAGVTVTALNISATLAPIDGPGGILGSAGPTAFSSGGGFVNSTAGIMNFDTADLAGLEAAGTLGDVIQHEMAHVMGFGTLWELNGLYTAGSGEYTGAYGLAAYQAEFDGAATFVPVELDGGPGTADGHWDETWAGGFTELMTGFLDTPTFVSDTTIQSFVDLGYCTAAVEDIVAGCDYITTPPPPPGEVPLPATGLLLFGALGGLGFAARRRKTK